MPIKDAIATVMSRNAFYRDGYRIMLRISLIQAGIIILLVAGLISLFLTVQTRQVYFATTADGRIINIVPLNEAYRSQAEVVAWAASVTQNVMRFGYHDYRERLQQVSSNFTTSGWESFTKALKESNILEAIQARKLVVTIDINGAPEIANAGVRAGVYTWDLKFPVTIRFDGNDPPQPIQTTLFLRITRVSTLQNPDGISIEQWVTNSGAR
ncbi:MAG: DotI/IcmL/TraM family protein [Alphaproteobacteria bacterium]